MAQHLNIVVCLRPPEDRVAAAGIGPRDLAALEYAVRLARREEGTVTVLATGGPDRFSVLREGVARGATTSVHVRAETQTTDPLETARRLHPAVRDLNPSLVSGWTSGLLELTDRSL